MSVTPRTTATVHAAGLAAAAALSAGAWFLAAAPLLRGRDAARVTAERLVQRDRQLREAENARRDAERLSARLQAELDRSVTLLPATRLNDRLAALSAACDRLGLSVDQLTPAAPEPGPRHVTVPVKLSGSATYAQGVALLATLARDFRDTSITGLVLKGDPTRPGERSAYSLDLAWHAAPAGFAGPPTTP